MRIGKENKLLIIAPYQFGELSDYYYWAKYATLEGWRITYIGYKYKNRVFKERKYPGVKVKSVMHINNRLILGMYFYLHCIIEILLGHHNNIVICRMPQCQLLARLFPKRNVILDVRTLSVSEDEKHRKKQDTSLIKIKNHFAKCTVISKGVGQRIGLPYYLLPLGAEELSIKAKSFDKIRLFYIGTFNNRDLSTFIKGLALYQKETGKEATFDIVGGGTDNEEINLKNSVIYSGVKGVSFHGYLTHEESKKFFDNCNIGVCYVPMKDYYQFQPPTKLYEYLLSGMAVLSTRTVSNVAVMSNHNGVLVDDNAVSVCNGLKELSSKMDTYSSSVIVDDSKKHHWKHIVNNNLLSLMQ